MNGLKEAGTKSEGGLSPGRCLTEQEGGESGLKKLTKL